MHIIQKKQYKLKPWKGNAFGKALNKKILDIIIIIY